MFVVVRWFRMLDPKRRKRAMDELKVGYEANGKIRDEMDEVREILGI